MPNKGLRHPGGLDHSREREEPIDFVEVKVQWTINDKTRRLIALAALILLTLGAVFLLPSELRGKFLDLLRKLSGAIGR